MLQTVINRLRSGDLSGLEGTDLATEIPVSIEVVNEVLAARPASPVQDLTVLALDKDEARLRLVVDPPVLGPQRRELRLGLRAKVVPGKEEWLYLDILDGLKFLDKPLLKFVSGMLADKLPGGVRVNADRVALHFPTLMRNAGQGGLLPAIAAFELGSDANRLIVRLHLKV